MLIQVQRDAFWLNWRRISNGEYPHYETVEEDFWKELNVFQSFVRSIGGNLDIVSLCDLTYVNIIGVGANDSGTVEFARVLPMLAAFNETASADRKLIGFNSTTAYRLSENLIIEAAARLGKRVGTDEQALIFELRARGAPNGYSFEGTKQWFNAAHEGTYRLFLDLTSEQIQHEVWKIK
jgi:uncharacterized protein (TIGR04255 family)